MLFNSYTFLFLYLPVVLAGYFLAARRADAQAAKVWLFVASLGFYAYWDVRYAPLLLASIAWNYAIGARIEKTRRKALLYLGVGVNLALLGYFKYTGFFIGAYNDVFGAALHVPEIVLPLGISFFTFTQTAYLVDAYRGETRGYTPLTYGLFVTVFPHLIAGPILYHKDMIPQFSDLRNFRFSYANAAAGLTFFCIGLAKKVAIADALAPWVGRVFDHAQQVSCLEAWGGSLAYTMQLYFDFSGYSEMAIGLGLLCNFKLPLNFDAPYKATSVSAFWRRWHMTLSAFLKSYLYIPLGGSRRGEWLRVRNLLLTMLLGGLWHGAGWTFVFWGALHGAFLVVHHLWRRWGRPLPALLGWALTFFCVNLAWVFFRADSLRDALALVQAMGDPSRIVLPERLAAHLGALAAWGVSFGRLPFHGGAGGVATLLLAAFLALFCSGVGQRMRRFRPGIVWLGAMAVLFFYSLYCLEKASDFLYFQF